MSLTTPLQTKRRRSFYLIAALLPLLLLALLEGLLRLAGLYQHYPLLLPSSQPGYVTLNPQLIKRYAPDPNQAPNVAPDSQFIAMPKPADRFRIVLMGGSSAAGFPYGRFGSPAAMLEQHLKLNYPAQQFDVINTAMAAVNSYTLLDISNEVLSLQPDLVLIYAGHNEYLGILGAASGQNHASRLLQLKLGKLALVQNLQRLYSGLQPDNDNAPEQTDRTLMATMAQQQQITLDSALYQAGLAQFEANMRLLLKQFSAAGVPVVLSTLAANEADQPPFASEALPTALHGEPISLTALQQFVQQQPQHALAHYHLAQALQRQGQHQLALKHYTFASDLDALRFRAPSAINGLIRQLSAEFNLPLADGQRQLRAASPDGIIGNNLMLEHLHPNADGYQLLAQAFFDSITPLLPFSHQIPRQGAWVSPLHELDVRLGERKIAQLTADYPFQASRRPLPAPDSGSLPLALLLQRLADEDWLSTQQALLKHYQQQQNAVSAATVAAQLSDALPFRADIASLAGQFFAASQHWPLAEYYQRRAIRLAPDDAQHYLLLSRSLYLSQQYHAALDTVQALLTRQPKHPQALRQQAQLQQLIAQSKNHSG
ncbi:hypothetical protein ABGI61_01665 [Rheinheimera sp. FR7-31]|uniref:SGNH/GDSL hydrolase family protein n=1 Tax=Rheinheimera fenheensis TaxID=3152295 RepID=UPI00325D076E